MGLEEGEGEKKERERERKGGFHNWQQQRPGDIHLLLT
jgi:hypothetical protein